MMFLADLLAATHGELLADPTATEFSGYAYDSRRVRAGQLFVAVQTATGDGHDYIAEAVTAGASGVLCQQVGDYGVTTILVPDTRQALLDYARWILRKHQPQVIGVTGSVGKTTTKEALAAVLSRRYRVFKNPGSYNDRYGLPIALGELTSSAEIAVLEMACDGFGEIEELAALTQPQLNIGVVTRISRAHLAGLGSLENIVLEKGRLVEALPPDGYAVLNADDPHVLSMAQRTPAQVVTFGFGDELPAESSSHLTATLLKVTAEGCHFEVTHQSRTETGFVPLVGQHQLYPILAALSVGLLHGISLADGLSALENLPRLPGRLQPLAGQNDSLLLDDAFNASPAAVRAALDTLAELPGASKIAVLGHVAELGHAESDILRELGQYAASRAEFLLGVGEAGQTLVQAAQKAGLPAERSHVAFTPADCADWVRERLAPGAVVLFEASAEARLERVAALLLANPADRRRLARSAPGWERVQLGLPARPTWVELDLAALRHNVRTLVAEVAPAKLLAVLKADGYGHGAVKVARTALNNGASWLGVATLGEGVILRQAGIIAPILVLGYLPAWQASEAIRHEIRATVFSQAVVSAFSEAAQRLQKPAYLHLKVDTGMGRLGVLPPSAVEFAQFMADQPGVVFEGIFTHFARADELDLGPSEAQLARFQAILQKLDDLSLRPALVHAANTAGALNLPSARFDMVRTGIGLYGLNPSAERPLGSSLRPVLSFKTTVAQVKTLQPGSPVGYGATYHTQAEETIAIIPVGYADGFRRGPQTWGAVLVKGCRAPLVGRVSMDQAAINVTGIAGVRQGDEVVLIGRQGSEEITADAVAEALGTINYEVVSEILARVPRVE